MHIAIGQGEIHKRVSGHWVRAGPKDSSIYTCKQAILVLNFKTHTLENNWTGGVLPPPKIMSLESYSTIPPSCYLPGDV